MYKIFLKKIKQYILFSTKSKEQNKISSFVRLGLKSNLFFVYFKKKNFIPYAFN